MPPRFSPAAVLDHLENVYALPRECLRVEPLVSYADQNFLVRLGREPNDALGADAAADAQRFVFKVAHPSTNVHHLRAEHGAMAAVRAGAPGVRCAEVILPERFGGASQDALGCAPQPEAAAFSEDGLCRMDGYWSRLLTFVPGTFLADVSPTRELRSSLGALLAQVDRALGDFEPLGVAQDNTWAMHNALMMADATGVISDPYQKWLADYAFDVFERECCPVLRHLKKICIHGDANIRNVLVGTAGLVDGVIDFGDLARDARVCELGIACAYVVLGAADGELALTQVAQVVAGYQAAYPLAADELGLVWPLVMTRLAVSLTHAWQSSVADPDNAYAVVDRDAAAAALDVMLQVSPVRAAVVLGGLTDSRRAVGATGVRDNAHVARVRGQHLNPAMSHCHTEPLYPVRAAGMWLYDAERGYLDFRNNPFGLGHCCPDVERAVRRQAGLFMGNSRYPHGERAAFIEALLATFPPEAGLSCVTITNSGSEANDLALRMARAHTGRQVLMTLAGSYHGCTAATMAVSEYKFAGAGAGAGACAGAGASAGVSGASIGFDGVEGLPRETVVVAGDPEAELAERLAGVDAACAVAADRGGAAAFIFESIQGVGGQVLPPAGFLPAAVARVREQAGARDRRSVLAGDDGAGSDSSPVIIADEVQTGCGRVGEHMWACFALGVQPDMVTIAKPLGNGYAVGAVVTTAAIGASFGRGPEYFNTTAGNPVACVAGRVVLERTGAVWQERARVMGAYLRERLEALQAQHAVIGDVRGMGLFLGVALCAPAEAVAQVADTMKNRGVLVSVDGPGRDVLILKPPLIVQKQHVDRLVVVLGDVLDGRFAD